MLPPEGVTSSKREECQSCRQGDIIASISCQLLTSIGRAGSIALCAIKHSVTFSQSNSPHLTFSSSSASSPSFVHTKLCQLEADQEEGFRDERSGFPMYVNRSERAGCQTMQTMWLACHASVSIVEIQLQQRWWEVLRCCRNF